MPGEIAAKEFYSEWDSVERRLMQEAEFGLGKGVELRLEKGNPLILDNDVAGNWLFANYAYATNFVEGRKPAIAEISARIRNINEEKSIAIPYSNFYTIGEVLKEFRNVESEYESEFAGPLVSYFESGGDCRGEKFERHLGQKVTDFMNFLEKHYENPENVVHKFPMIQYGMWKIISPPLSFTSYNQEDGKWTANSIHTHVGNKSWRETMMSDKDMKVILNEEIPKGSIDEIVERHYEYVMNIPGGQMLESIESASVKAGNDIGAKEKFLLKNPGLWSKYIDEIVEKDLIGVSHCWCPAERKMVVSPVIAEVQYNAAKGSLPDGLPLGISACYVEGAEKPVKINYLKSIL
ncbi:MAG: hypothetical protein V1813_01600 [Candidatus Aenigmatarchaeota archaeon]